MLFLVNYLFPVTKESQSAITLIHMSMHWTIAHKVRPLFSQKWPDADLKRPSSRFVHENTPS